MTPLEDFFTLSELKNGLSAPPRVKQLLGVIRKNEDSVSRNLCEAARQWSAVAATIAATDNQHCLDLFLLSGGLSFFDRWLRDAQTCSDDPVSDSIAAILKALEKLHDRGNERTRSSGIRSTVHDLLGHSSTPVKERAAALLDAWAHPGGGSVFDSGKLSGDGGCVLLDCSADSFPPEKSSAGVSGDGFSGKKVGAAADDFFPKTNSSTDSNILVIDSLKCCHRVASDQSGDFCSSEALKEEAGTGDCGPRAAGFSPGDCRTGESSGDRRSEDSTGGSEEDGTVSKPLALTAIEMEYGLMDALEVARKVANEVERELVDDAEACCTSPSEGPPYSPAGGSSATAEFRDANTVSALEVEQSLLTEAGPGHEAEKASHDFDLNRFPWSDVEEDDPFGTTVSVVSASRAAAAPCRPSIPLQFEGSCGWKGSAATSAFRPASPSPGNRGRPVPGIDLNVAEAGPSENASGDTSAWPDIDLNRAAEVESDNCVSDGPPDYARVRLLNPSPESMSSSVPPVVRDFDLNGPSDIPLQCYGRTAGEPATDWKVGPTWGYPPSQYPHPAVYGFNGFEVGPTVAFSPGVYMVDARGAPVVRPRAGALVPAVGPPYIHPQYMVGLSGGVGPPMGGSGLYAGGPGRSRPGLDLNYGLVDGGGISRLLALSEGGRADLGVGLVPGKRRVEMEGGWDPYLYRNKHLRPPWW